MTSSSFDEEVFLVPVDDDTVLVLPTTTRLDSAGGIDLTTLVQAVGPLIGAVVHHGGQSGAQLYELSPDSQRQLAEARRDEVGSYFRGVLRSSEGRISHQVQLREVQAAPAPSGFDALAAAQMAAVQEQLSRIEDTLDDIAQSVDEILGFVERQQRARVGAALRILRELHDRARRTGEITATDWGRLYGLEFELESQLQAVDDELSQLLGSRTFGETPKGDATQMKAVKPERVQELVRAHRMLVGGLRGWNELLLLRKYTAGELTSEEAEAARSRLEALETRHRDLIALIDAVVAASADAATRTWLNRLLSDGLVVGGRHDRKYAAEVRTARRQLQKSAGDAKAALPKPAARLTLNPPVEATDDKASLPAA